MNRWAILLACVVVTPILVIGDHLHGIASLQQQSKVTMTIDSAGATNDGSVLHVMVSGSHVLVVTNGIGKKYSIPAYPHTSPENHWRLPVVLDGSDFLIAGQRSNGLVVDTYGKKGKGYVIKASEVISDLSANPRVTNMKRLQSGAVLLAWYKQIFNDAKSYPCFSYRGSDGSWLTVQAEWDNLSMGLPWVTADFAQDPDGGIWYFGQHDSNRNICAIHLTDMGNSVRIDSVNPNFTTQYSGLLACEGESPYIVAEASADGIILAYHSSDYHFFSTNPFVKGAKINVTTVKNGVHSLLYQTGDYAERVNPFALMGTSIVYAPIDPLTLTYSNMVMLRGDGTKQNVGPPALLFRNSNKYFVYEDLLGEIKIALLQ